MTTIRQTACYALFLAICVLAQQSCQHTGNNASPKSDSHKTATNLGKKDASIGQSINEDITIPRSLAGLAYVVYDAPDNSVENCCDDCTFNREQHLQTNIPKSGVYFSGCSSKYHINGLKNGRLNFYKGQYQDGRLTNRTRMKSYQLDEYQDFKARLKNESGPIDLKYSAYDLVAIPLGIRPVHKENLARRLGRHIEGEVACFQVGMVKELFGLSDQDLQRIK